MKILITAPENENHTAPLKWALEQAGYSVACWAGLGWTEAKQASISDSSKIRSSNLAAIWLSPAT